MDRSTLLMFVSFLAGIEVTRGIVSNACYGTNPLCDFYSMSCPNGSVIKLNQLYAGRKTSNVCQDPNQRCADENGCCTLAINDLIEVLNLENTYNTYTNCSGRQTCRNIHAPWQQLSNGLTSTYVQLEYECKPVVPRLLFCGGDNGQMSGQYSSTDILFDGSAEAFNINKASRDCRCRVQNHGTPQLVTLTIIDMRMESYYKAENHQSAKCSSANFTSEAIVTKCAQTNAHYNTNFYYNEQYGLPLSGEGHTDILLQDVYKNGTTDSPSMIWINLNASEGMTVTCKELTPADFTTTTTTTTTTSTTTTTTPTITTTTPTTTTTTPTTTTTTPTTTTTTPTTTTTTPTTTTTTPTTTTTTTTTPTTTTTTTTPTTTTTTTPTTTTTSTTTTTTTPTTTTTKPTTTTTTSTTTTTTKTTPTTTTSTSTTTTKPPTTTTTSTTTTTTAPVTTSLRTTTDSTDATDGVTVPSDGLSVSDDSQKTVVYIAIFVPIAVCLFIIVLFLLWIYWKRTVPHRDKFNLTKYHRGADPYKTLTDLQILDKFIHQQGIKANGSTIRTGSVIKAPINATTVVAVPSVRNSVSAEEFQKKISEKYVPMEGSVYSASKSPIQPYTIPIHGTKHNPLYTAAAPAKKPSKPQPHVYHVKLGPNLRYNTDEFPTSQANTTTVNEKVPDVKKDETDVVNEPTFSTFKKPANEDVKASVKKENPMQKKPDNYEGIVIHVDNLSNPPSSSRTNQSGAPSLSPTSSRSLAGSTSKVPSTVDNDPEVKPEDVENTDGKNEGSDVSTSSGNNSRDEESGLLIRF